MTNTQPNITLVDSGFTGQSGFDGYPMVAFRRYEPAEHIIATRFGTPYRLAWVDVFDNGKVLCTFIRQTKTGRDYKNNSGTSEMLDSLEHWNEGETRSLARDIRAAVEMVQFKQGIEEENAKMIIEPADEEHPMTELSVIAKLRYIAVTADNLSMRQANILNDAFEILAGRPDLATATVAALQPEPKAKDGATSAEDRAGDDHAGETTRRENIYTDIVSDLFRSIHDRLGHAVLSIGADLLGEGKDFGKTHIFARNADGFIALHRVINVNGSGEEHEKIVEALDDLLADAGHSVTNAMSGWYVESPAEQW